MPGHTSLNCPEKVHFVSFGACRGKQVRILQKKFMLSVSAHAEENVWGLMSKFILGYVLSHFMHLGVEILEPARTRAFGHCGPKEHDFWLVEFQPLSPLAAAQPWPAR